MMKKNILKWLSAVLCAFLLLTAAGCGSAPDDRSSESSAVPTADPNAYSTLYTAEPTAEPTPEPETAQPVELTVELESMYPLLKAHVLSQLNGGVFNAENAEYFWQTMTFAIDGCGLDFYSSETMGNALLLSRGVIEEIASGLFENGGGVLLEIPESLSGEIQYDIEADAFAHPLGESNFTIVPSSVTENEEGSVTLNAELYSALDTETAIVSFTAVLVPNTRSGNSLFTWSVRSVSLT